MQPRHNRLSNTRRTISSKASIGATETNIANKRNYKRKIKRKTVATVSNQQSTGREEKWSISFLFLSFVAYSFDTSESMFGRSYSHVVVMFNMRQKKNLDRIVFGIPHSDLFLSLSLEKRRYCLVLCAQHLPLLMLSEHQPMPLLFCLFLCVCVCVCVTFTFVFHDHFDTNV